VSRLRELWLPFVIFCLLSVGRPLLSNRSPARISCSKLAAMSRIEQGADLTVLMSRMHSDLQVYCESVERLSHRDGTMTLDVAYERSERARIAFELARDRLKAYLAEHGRAG